jgi:hypothetical protein
MRIGLHVTGIFYHLGLVGEKERFVFALAQTTFYGLISWVLVLTKVLSL